MKNYVVAIIIMIVCFPVQSKTIFGKEIAIPSYPGTVNICEANIKFWELAQATIVDGTHVLSCFIDKSIVKQQQLPDGFQMFTIGIPRNYIQLEISTQRYVSEMNVSKKQLLDFYNNEKVQSERSEEEIKNTQALVNNMVQDIKYEKLNFIQQNDKVLSWVEHTRFKMDGGYQTILVSKAYILVKGKMLFLSINSVGDESESSLIEKSNKWIELMFSSNP